MTEIAISVRNISKCYHVYDNQRSRLMHAIWPKHKTGMQEIWALKDINFEIRRGDSVAIIGRNGGGKSTLLEILTGTLTPTSGEVTVDGRVSALLELGSGFNPEYTGRDNVILNGLLLGLSRQDIMSRFNEIEAFAEIGPAIDRPVKTYSSGMMMRLAFAVQVLCDPDILIIDEALSVGDFFFQQKCLSYIRDLRARGTTLLFVSHDMGTVRDICTRGILLGSGKINFCGDIITAIRHYLSKDNSNIENEAKSAMEMPDSEALSISETKTFKLKQPLWTHKSIDKSKVAQILGVSILDSQGNAASVVKIGAEVIIQTLFTSSSSRPVHVTVVLKNKYDQIVTSIGSYTLKTARPKTASGFEFLYQLKVNLSIEAGNYVFCVILGETLQIGDGGTLFDETPWLGPIQVDWDYQTEIPPFYGMVGLPTKAQFMTEKGSLS